MLTEAAARAGAQVRTNTSVVGCRHDGVTWHVQCADGRTFSSRLVIDATGRRAGVSRCLGAQQVPFDRLVAIATCWGDVDVTDEQYLLIESTADGWWYTAPLPANGMVGMLLTDADLCRRYGLSGTARFDGKLREAANTAARVKGASSRSAPRVHSAASHRLTRSSDMRPWLSVGDAALAVDPVTGSGVLRALRTGKVAAYTAERMLDHPRDVAPLVEEYESALDVECTIYLTARGRYYGSVRQYLTPFWTRRR
jgi:flavin-dependent dehydrogenase